MVKNTRGSCDDLHASGVGQKLIKLCPNVRFERCGGDVMRIGLKGLWRIEGRSRGFGQDKQTITQGKEEILRTRGVCIEARSRGLRQDKRTTITESP